MTEAPHRLRVFLCHSSGDKPIVREIYKKLRGDSFEPWLDEEDLIGGQKWQDEIVRMIQTSHVVLVCLSRSSVDKSGYLQKEIRLALDTADKQPAGTIFLIPVKLEECDFPEQLKCWHCVNFYEEGGYERLRKALQYRTNTLKENIQSPAIRVPELSNSENQLFEQGHKAYWSASTTAPWLLIIALLIHLFVSILLRPYLDTPSPVLPPKPCIVFQTDGIEIRNANNYPINNLQAYLIAYRVDKVRRNITGRTQVMISNLVLDNLQPQQVTKILTRSLIPPAESNQFEATLNSDEIIMQALVITYHRNIDKKDLLEVEPFSVTQLDRYRPSLLFSLRLPANSITAGLKPYEMSKIVQDIEGSEKYHFGPRELVVYK